MRPFPNISASLALALGLAAAACAQEDMPAPALEVTAELPNAPGNVTVTPEGLVVASVHPSYPSDIVALAADGRSVAVFPDATHGQVSNDGSGPGMRRILSVRADRQGRVWMLAGMPGPAPKTIYVWNIAEDAMDRVIEVPTGPAALPSSFYNDMALALDHGVIVISDPASGGPALVVLDVASGIGRRVLVNDPSVSAEDVDARIDGIPLAQARDANGDLVPVRAAVNPITIDSSEEWVYYGAMSGTSLYRVRLSDLMDESLSPEALSGKVERYGDKAPSAGITIDDAGNVYVNDGGARGVGVIRPDGSYRVLVQDDTLLDWPDGVAVGDDGYVYVAVNGLYRTWASHADYGPPQAPFPMVRFKALAHTTAGR